MMDRCPLSRATLNGADTCRRCRAELGTVKRVERESQAVLDAAIHSLLLDDAAAAAGQLLRRALALHATPEVRALAQFIAQVSRPSGVGDHGDPDDV